MDSKTEEFVKDIFKPEGLNLDYFRNSTSNNIFPISKIKERMEEITIIKEEITNCINQKRHLLDEHEREYDISDSQILTELKEILKKYNLYG